MLKNNWGGKVLECSSSVPFQNMFPSTPCPKQGQNTPPVCYSPCCTSGGKKKPPSTPEQGVLPALPPYKKIRTDQKETFCLTKYYEVDFRLTREPVS